MLKEIKNTGRGTKTNTFDVGHCSRIILAPAFFNLANNENRKNLL